MVTHVRAGGVSRSPVPAGLHHLRQPRVDRGLQQLVPRDKGPVRGPVRRPERTRPNLTGFPTIPPSGSVHGAEGLVGEGTGLGKGYVGNGRGFTAAALTSAVGEGWSPSAGRRNSAGVPRATLGNPGRLPAGGVELLFQEEWRLWSPHSPPSAPEPT